MGFLFCLSKSGKMIKKEREISLMSLHVMQNLYGFMGSWAKHDMLHK